MGVFRFTRTELGKHLIISYSIQEEIQKLKTTESKAYYYLYADSGFELGFGKSGKYSGHSHKFFYDILFSQNQISTRDADGKAILGNLILVPPRTFLGEVQTSDFFFLKFSPSNDKIDLPDKVDEVLSERIISCFSQNADVKIPWFKKYLSDKSLVSLTLDKKTLIVKIGEVKFIIN